MPGGQIVGRFQSLMHSGAWVAPFIEHLTEITNRMLHAAPPARAVMHEVARFTSGCPLVAHNAAFDRTFWHAEQARAECAPVATHAFACTLLLSRRLYPLADNHRLGTLAKLHALLAALQRAAWPGLACLTGAATAGQLLPAAREPSAQSSIEKVRNWREALRNSATASAYTSMRAASGCACGARQRRPQPIEPP